MKEESRIQEEAVLEIEDLYYDYYRYSEWLRKEKEHEEYEKKESSEGCVIMQM